MAKSLPVKKFIAQPIRTEDAHIVHPLEQGIASVKPAKPKIDAQSARMGIIVSEILGAPLSKRRRSSRWL